MTPHSDGLIMDMAAQRIKMSFSLGCGRVEGQWFNAVK